MPPLAGLGDAGVPGAAMEYGVLVFIGDIMGDGEDSAAGNGSAVGGNARALPSPFEGVFVRRRRILGLGVRDPGLTTSRFTEDDA